MQPQAKYDVGAEKNVRSGRKIDSKANDIA
jgi:hypothetical protein